MNEVVRDPSLDIMGFINEDKASVSDTNTGDVPVKQERKLTPLEKAMQASNDVGGGIVVDQNKYKGDNEKVELKNFTEENPQRQEDFDKYIAEMDNETKAARLYVMTVPQTDKLNYMNAMEELRLVAEHIKEKGEIDLPDNLKYIRRRTEAELAEFDVHINDMGDREKIKEHLMRNQEIPNQTSENQKIPNTDSENQNTNAVNDKIVTLLIDKTGYGAEPIEFTEEERKKIVNADVLKVAKVTPIDIDVAKVKAPVKSYTEYLKERESDLSAKKVILPFSGYSCIIRGLGAYEVADLIINEDDPVNFETNLRKFSLIYKAISWFSTSKIQTFDDFLKHTSHFDWDLLQYGLIMASYPDEDEMPITCGRCGHTFSIPYRSTSLIDYNDTALKVKEKMTELLDADPKELEDIFDNSSVNTYKSIPLPNGYRIDVGSVSLYDYLYDVSRETIVPEKGKELTQAETKDNLVLVFLEAIRAIYVPNGDEYYKYTSAKEMTNIIKGLDLRSFNFLRALIGKVEEESNISFSIRGLHRCPKCNNEIKHIPVDMYNVVFYKGTNLVEVDLSGLDVF